MIKPERNHWDVLIALVMGLALVLCVERTISCIGHNGYPNQPKQTERK